MFFKSLSMLFDTPGYWNKIKITTEILTIRYLNFYCYFVSIMKHSSVHLPNGRSCHWLIIKYFIFSFPILPKLLLHHLIHLPLWHVVCTISYTLKNILNLFWNDCIIFLKHKIVERQSNEVRISIDTIVYEISMALLSPCMLNI